MPRPLLKLLAVAAFSYAAICLILFSLQRSLIYFPQPRAITAGESPLKLANEAGELVVTVRPHAGRKAILYFGGNAEDVSLNLPSFAVAFPEHALYLMHYRSYGGSAGSPSEEAIQQDALALFDKVRGEHAEVAVIGRSLGSGVAVRLASQRPASRLVLITPYASLEEIAASQYPYVPVKWLLRDKFDSASYAPQISPPTTLLVAEHDEVIPMASSQRLFARFTPGRAALKVIADTEHNSISDSTEYLAVIRAAL